MYIPVGGGGGRHQHTCVNEKFPFRGDSSLLSQKSLPNSTSSTTVKCLLSTLKGTRKCYAIFPALTTQFSWMLAGKLDLLQKNAICSNEADC